MLNRLFRAVQKASIGSDFDHYFNSVIQKNAPHSPTVDEAKRDYRSAVRAGI